MMFYHFFETYLPWKRVLLLGSIISLIILYCPLIGIILPFFLGAPPAIQDELIRVFSLSNTLLLIKSVVLALGSVLLSFFIALHAGTWIWMRNGTRIEKLRWVILLLIPVPVYIHALTWSSVISWAGEGQRLLGVTLSPLTGWIITLWVQAFAILPIALGIVIISLDLLDNGLLDVSRVFRTDHETLRKVILPLVSPFLLSGAGILFVLCITDYTIPSLFSVTVYSLGIFSAFSATNEPVSSLIQSLPLLLITITIIIWSVSRLSCTFQEHSLHSYQPGAGFILPGHIRAIQSGCMFFFITDMILILGILLFQTVSGKGALQSLMVSWSDIICSIEIAFWVAVVSLPLAVVLGWNLNSGEKKILWWILVLIPVAIPAPLIGIGLITISTWIGSQVLSESIILPVLASVIRFTPFAAFLFFSVIRSIDPGIWDAGYIFGRDRWNILKKIEVPLLLPGALAASGFMVVLTLCELGATLLVLPPGSSTITIRVYNYLHYGGSGSVAALCLLIVAMIACGTCLTLFLVRRKGMPDMFREHTNRKESP